MNIDIYKTHENRYILAGAAEGDDLLFVWDRGRFYSEAYTHPPRLCEEIAAVDPVWVSQNREVMQNLLGRVLLYYGLFDSARELADDFLRDYLDEDYAEKQQLLTGLRRCFEESRHQLLCYLLARGQLLDK